jgi:pimeloyl-ACP methyl ester carboxylesterase
LIINVESAGPDDAEDVVLVHGAGGSAATWFMQLRGLSKEFRIHAVELNGHGSSRDREEPDTMRAYLKDIDSVIEQLDEPILGGHSMGGALTQQYALDHPGSLRGIILVGTGARLRCTPMIFHLLERDFEAYLDALSEFMFHSDTDPRIIDASRAEAARCKPEVISRDFGMCDKFDIMEEVNSIDVPALIIVGESDVMTPVKYSQYLADEIPHSELVVIPKAGHAVMLEQPNLVNDAIREWVMSLESRGG